MSIKKNKDISCFVSLKDILNKKKNQKIIFCSILIIFFIAIYTLNRLYPLLAEDWDYSFIWVPGNDSPDRIMGLKDILNSQYNHYMNWGGRSVTHAVLQFVLMLDPLYGDILNSLVFILYLYLVYKIVNHGHTNNTMLFLFTASALWIFLPEFMSTTIWLTYSLNYLWSTTFILFFIFPYYRYYREEKKNDSLLKKIAMFLAGVIAGWTNENMSLAMIAFILLIFILYKKDKIGIPIWAITGLAGAIIGATLLISAPGNFVRLEESTGDSFSFFDRLSGINYNLCKVYFYNIFILLVIYVVLFIFSLKNNIIKKSVKLIYSSLIFVISAHIGVCVLIVSPEFPERVFFGIITFLIIAIGILSLNIVDNVKKMKGVFCIIAIIFFTFSVIKYIDRYQYTAYLYNFWQQRELYMLEQKEKGIKDIIFSDKVIKHKEFIIFDLSADPQSWVNRLYSKYYGLHSVKRIKE